MHKLHRNFWNYNKLISSWNYVPFLIESCADQFSSCILALISKYHLFTRRFRAESVGETLDRSGIFRYKRKTNSLKICMNNSLMEWVTTLAWWWPELHVIIVERIQCSSEFVHNPFTFPHHSLNSVCEHVRFLSLSLSHLPEPLLNIYKQKSTEKKRKSEKYSVRNSGFVVH